eukprot:3462573-Rhodomonas_salina.1
MAGRRRMTTGYRADVARIEVLTGLTNRAPSCTSTANLCVWPGAAEPTSAPEIASRMRATGARDP